MMRFLMVLQVMGMIRWSFRHVFVKQSAKMLSVGGTILVYYRTPTWFKRQINTTQQLTKVEE